MRYMDELCALYTPDIVKVVNRTVHQFGQVTWRGICLHNCHEEVSWKAATFEIETEV
jgi:hypothetical protein